LLLAVAVAEQVLLAVAAVRVDLGLLLGLLFQVDQPLLSQLAVGAQGLPVVEIRVFLVQIRYLVPLLLWVVVERALEAMMAVYQVALVVVALDKVDREAQGLPDKGIAAVVRQSQVLAVVAQVKLVVLAHLLVAPSPILPASAVLVLLRLLAALL
jgi:hypothetical protein